MKNEDVREPSTMALVLLWATAALARLAPPPASRPLRTASCLGAGRCPSRPAARAWPLSAPPGPSPQVPNKGDTAWMMVSTLLVIMMTVPGLALFYGGLVRSKNMLSVLMRVMVTFSLIVVLWVIYGYSFAFTEGNAFFGGTDRLFKPASGTTSRGSVSAAPPSARAS